VSASSTPGCQARHSSPVGSDHQQAIVLHCDTTHPSFVTRDAHQVQPVGPRIGTVEQPQPENVGPQPQLGPKQNTDPGSLLRQRMITCW
jgi:hypothetical protein